MVFEAPRQFDAAAASHPWQYKTWDAVREVLALREPWFGTVSTYQVAGYAQGESGFFGLFARSLRRYLCNDPAIRKKINDTLAKTRAGGKISALTPEGIVGTGGIALGAFLVQQVPFLGMVGAPVTAGLVVILHAVGMDAFCRWSDGLRTNEDEKH